MRTPRFAVTRKLVAPGERLLANMHVCLNDEGQLVAAPLDADPRSIIGRIIDPADESGYARIVMDPGW